MQQEQSMYIMFMPQFIPNDAIHVPYTLKGFATVSKSPPYARDMWAFGQLVVAIVTRTESNSDDDGLLNHTKSCLLNDNPEVCDKWNIAYVILIMFI